MKKTDEKIERVTIYLPTSLVAELEAKALEAGHTRTGYIRWLLVQLMKAQKTC